MPPKNDTRRDNPRKRTISSSARDKKINSNDGPTILPLTSLSHTQIGKALARLQLCAPDGYKTEDCVKLLACSKVFMKSFYGYNTSTISAIFDKDGDFIDFRSTDGKISGIFRCSNNNIRYPCCVCAAPVTDEDDLDSLTFGVECSGCSEYFHNSCCNNPMTRDLHDSLDKSPSYIKIFCPNCEITNGNIAAKLEAVEQRCKMLESKLDSLKPGSYSSAVGGNSNKSSGSNTMVNLPKSVVKGLTDLTKAQKQVDDAEKLKRTRVVIRPADTTIRTSRDIRCEFNKHYQGVIIEQCRVTAGGSIMFEFENEQVATEVNDKWEDSYFGGNKGMKIPGGGNSIGLIKYVYDTDDTKQIEEEIKKVYPVAECDFFKRKSDGKFSGMIKVDFGNDYNLENAINNKIAILQQRYQVVELIC